ncbi:MAG: MBL fold metallo-hydrolase [Oscillospiraceae bacterium]|nr:MBL fold metallo-hydrolase [Oscillospiraceae bacterium]
MKLWVLAENTALPGFAAEHGLSLYIETGSRRILFDAGQSGIFADNARKLGIDLSRVDLAVLSHGHYDHGGGLLRFLELNDTAPIYVNQHAPEPYFNAQDRYIGLSPALLESDRLSFVEDSLDLGDGLSLHSCNGWQRHFPVDSFGLQKQAGEALVSDDFLHEQYLLIQEGSRRVLVSGCSHKGVVNIARWFSPDVLVGGFHFSKLPVESEQLQRSAACLLEQNTVYYTGHCTGQPQFHDLKRTMGDRLYALTGGMEFTL